MSSITLNRIIDQCTQKLLISTGKKTPITAKAAHGLMDAAWDAYEHRKRIEPLASACIPSTQVKSDIIAIKGELDRLLPICKRISVLAERELCRKWMDTCSKVSIGLSAASLLIPVQEGSSITATRLVIFATMEIVAACAIFGEQLHEHYP